MSATGPATGVLASRDVNSSIAPNTQQTSDKSNIKSMEYHRQVLQNKVQNGETKQYISPSDNIMSPCTAKLNAYRSKQVGKAKPKSLFAQKSSQKLEGGDIFGMSKPAPAP